MPTKSTSTPRRSRPPLADNLSLCVTPVYDSHPDHDVAAPLILRQFPVTLGRLELCELWWMNCPFKCQRTPANSSSSSSVVCERYCQTIRKVVVNDVADAAAIDERMEQDYNDDDDNNISHHYNRHRQSRAQQQQQQHNYELLSRRAIHVSEYGHCKIIASHSEYFQLSNNGRLTRNKGVFLRVAGAMEVWMRFHLQLIESTDGAAAAAATQKAKRVKLREDDVMDSNEENHSNTQNTMDEARRLLRDPRESESQQSPKQQPTKSGHKKTKGSADEDDTDNSWFRAASQPTARKRCRYQLQLTESSESQIKHSIHTHDSQETTIVMHTKTSHTLAAANDSPARRALFSAAASCDEPTGSKFSKRVSPSKEQSARASQASCSPCRDHDKSAAAGRTRVNRCDQQPSLHDRACPTTTTTIATVVRRDLTGAPLVKVVTPDLDDYKKAQKRKFGLQVESDQTIDQATQSLQLQLDDGRGLHQANGNQQQDSPLTSQEWSESVMSSKEETLSSRRCQTGRLKMPSISFLLDSVPASHGSNGSHGHGSVQQSVCSCLESPASLPDAQAVKVPARQLQHNGPADDMSKLLPRHEVNMTATLPQMSMESMLDMKLEASFDSQEAAAGNMYEHSQTKHVAAATRCISDFTYADWLEHRTKARVGSYRRAMIDLVLRLNNKDQAGEAIAEEQGALLLLPALLNRDTLWMEGDDYV